MRELKFRVWDKRYKQYVEPYAICLDGRAISIAEPNNDLETLDSECVIIEFNTGFKDKNGKEIYSGHIIVDFDEFIEIPFNKFLEISEKVKEVRRQLNERTKS